METRSVRQCLEKGSFSESSPTPSISVSQKEASGIGIVSVNITSPSTSIICCNPTPVAATPSLVNAIPVVPTPVYPSPVSSTPANPPPMNPAPVYHPPVSGTPANSPPMNPAPAYPPPVNVTPANPASVSSTPVKSTPVILQTSSIRCASGLARDQFNTNPFILKFKTKQIKVYEGVNDTMGLVVARVERRMVSNLATGTVSRKREQFSLPRSYGLSQAGKSFI